MTFGGQIVILSLLLIQIHGQDGNILMATKGLRSNFKSTTGGCNIITTSSGSGLTTSTEKNTEAITTSTLGLESTTTAMPPTTKGIDIGSCEDQNPSCAMDPILCSTPSYYFKCKNTCGCLGACNDDSEYCIKFPLECMDDESKIKCPRFCGHCSGCNDVLKPELCEALSGKCSDENVGYFCTQTCGKCQCTNRLSYDIVCNSFKSQGLCSPDSIYYEFMKFSCAKTCKFGGC